MALVSARSLVAGAEITTDVCVVGGGPAGMTVALELQGRGLQVCLVESGGIHVERDSQALSRGELSGQPYYSLDRTRYRAFGGSAHRWISRRMRPLDPLDFEARPGVPHSGWPISRDELDPHYRRAHELLGLGPFDYDAASWADEDSPMLPLPASHAMTTMFQFGPADSLLRHRGRLVESSDVDVLLDATALELVADSSGRRVTAVVVAASPDHRITVNTKVVVLAGGGIENARLLLLSRRRHPAGLGNGHDLVGRFFMEHPHLRTGVLRPARADLLGRLRLYSKHEQRGVTVMGKLRPSPDVVRSRELLQTTWAMRPVPAVLGTAPAAALAGLREAPGRFGAPDAGRRMLTVASHPVLSTAAARQLLGQRWPSIGTAPTSLVELHAMCEQAPNPSSRVALGRRRDRFGQPVPHVEWRLTDLDLQSIRSGQDLLDHAFTMAGLGRVVSKFGDTDVAVPVGGGLHHMGTTRMHASPRSGVVDRHCRVHETSNVYVAGSSLFPTSGYANPTLTLVALSVRLAQHLRRVV